jgi:branched-chain amino acid aminotransferase
MTTGLVWRNGELLPADSATTSVFDHGLTVGDGVFETLKAVDGAPFAARRHLDRLRRSAAGLGLEVPYGDAELRAAMDAVLTEGPRPLARVRVTVTGGVAPLGSERGADGPQVIVATGPLAQPAESTAVITVPWTRNERGAMAGIKTTSYAENVRALAKAHQRGATEALFANTVGLLCEGTGSNVFVVVDGQVLTPPLTSGCLAGVTRALVLESSAVVEQDLPLEILTTADEVFLTSTGRDVQAVHLVDDRSLEPGPVTEQVAAAFAQLALDVDP